MGSALLLYEIRIVTGNSCACLTVSSFFFCLCKTLETTENLEPLINLIQILKCDYSNLCTRNSPPIRLKYVCEVEVNSVGPHTVVFVARVYFLYCI